MHVSLPVFLDTVCVDGQAISFATVAATLICESNCGTRIEIEATLSRCCKEVPKICALKIILSDIHVYSINLIFFHAVRFKISP